MSNSTAFHTFNYLVPLEIDKHKDLFPDELAFKKYSRKFNIDLAPKILFSKSQSVDCLIDSGAANYLEFNSVSDNFCFEGIKTG